VLSRGSCTVEDDMAGVGLAAHDDSSREIFSKSGAKWFPTRGKGAVSGDSLCNVDTASKGDPPPRPGPIYVYDPMLYVTTKTFLLTDEEAFQTDSDNNFVLKDGQKIPDDKKRLAIAKQALELGFKKGMTGEQKGVREDPNNPGVSTWDQNQ